MQRCNHANNRLLWLTLMINRNRKLIRKARTRFTYFLCAFDREGSRLLRPDGLSMTHKNGSFGYAQNDPAPNYGKGLFRAGQDNGEPAVMDLAMPDGKRQAK
jgi:hypothetical protein